MGSVSTRATRPARRARLVGALIAAGTIAGLGVGCGNSPTGPSADCGGGLSFTNLPVPAGAINSVSPLGSMNPPAHTIPTDHVYFYLNGTGIPLSSPGPFRITGVRTTHYLTSTFRTGQSDFSVTGNLCGGYQLGLAHIQTLVPKLQDQTGGNCTTYSTADETVQSCENDGADIEIASGETLGTVGSSWAGAFDFGLYRNTGRARGNTFVNPSRYSSLTLSAVCPYDPFTPGLRGQIDALLGQPGFPPSGESPTCGTMNVDVAGTAAGVWVMQSAPVNQNGNETNFVVLAPHPLYPQSGQAFSMGPPALASVDGTARTRYPVENSGRVNRQFRAVTADAQIYCYSADLATSMVSYFVRVSGSVLTLQRVTHAPGATPCAGTPASWAFDGTAIDFIR